MSQSDTVPTPQAVASPITSSAFFIVATINQDAESCTRVRDWCAGVAGLVRAVSARAPTASLSCVVGFGSAGWDRLFGQPRPPELHPFREFGPAQRRAPATPGDLLLHIRANQTDLAFELAAHLMEGLSGAVTTVDEVHGFRNFDQRAIIGFVDGTENPVGDEAVAATIIGGSDADFAGGSYVITQKYLHDMKGWNALPVDMQERIIGRTKADDIELADDVKPSWAHNALTVIEDENGEEIDILRDNMPFGRPGMGEFGTFFIGYASSPQPVERMIENMFVGVPPGNYDRLLDFSTAVTGNLFFVPSQPLLAALAERRPDGSDVSAAAQAVTPVVSEAPVLSVDGTLIIGSLKGAPSYE